MQLCAGFTSVGQDVILSVEMNPDSSENKKTIRTFGAASFLNDLGSDIIYPVWPLFVTTVLKANMASLGFLDGIGEAFVSLSQAGSGYLSDRMKKRKIFIWTGYCMGALSRLGYAISSVWTHLIPFRTLDRLGKIRSAPRDALVADISTEYNRGRNFGLLRAMDHLGAVTGILICIAFFRVLGYRLLFTLAAIPSVISALLVIFLIKEKPAKLKQMYRGISLKDLDRNFGLLLVLSALFALAAFSYSFLLIFAQRSGFAIGIIPVFYLIFTVSASLFSIPFGKLSDKIGRKPVLALSFFLWAAVCLSLIIGRNSWIIICSFVLYGAHKGALEPVQRAYVCELAPEKFRASALGGFQMVVGLCALPASFIAGVLWESISMFAPFLFSLSLTSAAIILLLFVKNRISD
jgi:MFS family permease